MVVEEHLPREVTSEQSLAGGRSLWKEHSRHRRQPG